MVAGTVIGNFSTIDSNENDTFTYTLVSENGFTDNDAFTIDGNSLKIKNSPDFETKPSYNIRIRTTDKGGLFFEKPLTIQVNNLDIPTNLTYSGGSNIFTIEGEGSNAKLQFTLTGRNSNFVNELGVFKVDDEKGTINSITPGSAGYVEAALERAKVVFSAISNPPLGFNQINTTSSIEFNSGDKLGFFLVRNGTIDAVRSGATPTSEILFSRSETQKVEVLGNGQFSLAWEDGKGNSVVDFNDLVVKAVATNQPIPLGASYQATPEGELIDLRDVNGQVKATFTVNREAAFNNYVTFYRVADVNGSVDFDNNGTVDLRPGDTGYALAAIQSRVAGLDLTVSNQGAATFTIDLNGGLLYAPLIISNGKPEELLDNNPNNDPDVYFGSSIANPGRFDHTRLLGNNAWGFEDLPLGGDRDYNDVIVQANFSRI
ncbi:hypothetical protein NIES4071_44060 [Calothrix sp. NIES-4071]|nr:hypothetical protein NIES4071_44060 [Calothrix sp. NIES-4071]BAZ58720.1 hypothetical protein NIES4105_43990 [Calothrix sp. NIES-4105]